MRGEVRGGEMGEARKERTGREGERDGLEGYLRGAGFSFGTTTFIQAHSSIFTREVESVVEAGGGAEDEEEEDEEEEGVEVEVETTEGWEVEVDEEGGVGLWIASWKI